MSVIIVVDFFYNFPLVWAKERAKNILCVFLGTYIYVTTNCRPPSTPPKWLLKGIVS
jgi:hypothetical protein